MAYDKCIVRSFYISTESRDKARFPHPSQFTYDLPLTLTNVMGVHVRHYKFPKELLVNENNRRIQVTTETITGSVVVNKGDYELLPLLTELNSKLDLYGVAFSVDEDVGRVVLTFTDEYVNSVALTNRSLLTALGFGRDVCLCRNGALPPPTFQGNVYQTSAVAENVYDVNTISDMILRIADLETILSNDAVTNRATMILYSNMDANFVMLSSNNNAPLMLLQKQHRLQALRITLLNTLGDLYDTVGSEATFLLDVYCAVE